MVTGLLLALSASALWGAADFAGGRLSRRLPLVAVVSCTQAAGFVGLMLVLLLRGRPEPAAAGWGALAGALSVGSVFCLYRALAIGTMGVVAPVVSAGAVVPVAVGLAGGERPGPVALGGVVFVLLGVVLVSRQVAPVPPVDHRLSVLLALAGAVFVGAQLTVLRRAGVVDALTGVAACRAVSLAVFLTALVVARPSAPVSALPAAAGVGILDTTANLAYTSATASGMLSLTAVLASLYPVVTVALARALLDEHLRWLQWVGAVLAVAGVVLIAAS